MPHGVGDIGGSVLLIVIKYVAVVRGIVVNAVRRIARVCFCARAQGNQQSDKRERACEKSDAGRAVLGLCICGAYFLISFTSTEYSSVLP